MNFFAKALGFNGAVRAVGALKDKIDPKEIILREAHRLRSLMIEQFNEQEPKTQDFGDWPEWKPLTSTEREIEGVTGRSMLVRSGDLRNAIAVIQTGRGAWVGVVRKAKRNKKRGQRRAAKRAAKGGRKERKSESEEKRKEKLDRKRAIAKVAKAAGMGSKGRGSRNLANVAATMEFGSPKRAVKMTPAMRRFLFGVLFKKAGTAGKVPGKQKGFVVYSIPARPFLRPAAAEWENTLDESLKKSILATLQVGRG